MRNYLILLGATALTACGGGGTGVQTVGGSAPPAGGGSTPTSTHSFVAPTEVKTYDGIGAIHSFSYATRSDGSTQYAEIYAGDSTTPRDGGISVTYSPRDAIFDIIIRRANANVDQSLRFQDPVHRTDFDGARRPQAGVPNIEAARNIQYLEAGTGNNKTLDPNSPNYPGYSTLPFGAPEYEFDAFTFFYQKPGTTTKYVTYAGWIRNAVSVTEETIPSVTGEDELEYTQNAYTLERAAFVFGERTPNSAVPRTGSGNYAGEMIATMVFNPDLDTNPQANTYFQWIIGNASHKVDFGTLGILSSFTGRVGPIARDAYTNGQGAIAQNSLFTANSSATIDLAGKSGFTGQFSDGKFTRPDGSTFTLNIAGSTIDGAFFGPNSEEIGGAFRIVGGTPDERIDIHGAFTGKK